MSFVDKIIRSSNSPFVFVKGFTQRGTACFIVLFCNNRKVLSLQQTIGHESVNLEEYGKVIAKGYGHFPSDEYITTFQEKYNFNLEEII